MGRESNLQSTALEFLNCLPGCVAENVSGNSAQSGRPDINGCYKGRMFKIELKTPDNEYQASKKQKLTMRRWLRAGCVVATIYSMKSLRYMFSLDWESKEGDFVYREANDCLSVMKFPDWSEENAAG